MARNNTKSIGANEVIVGVYTSEPNARTGKGGGVEYVQFMGPGVSAAIMTGGVGPLLATYGISVAPAKVYFSADGYGDGRSHVVRVKRADAEGLKPVTKAPKAAATLAPWTPPAKR
jgi:hypothetical protein